MVSKKKKATVKEEKQFSDKRVIILSTVLVSIIILGSILFFTLSQTPNQFSLNAAIIDQLGDHFPNPQFVNNVTTMLETAGFNVTYHRSIELDVSFFKELAKSNYGVVILRVHSALRDDESTVDLFTSEKFKTSYYLEEQNNDLLVRGILNYSQRLEEYFALTSEFIKSLEGTFPKSIVIAMGCWSLKPECKQMAEAFIKKGATVYIGWAERVDVSHTDNETVSLLKMLLEDNKTVEQAVTDTLPDWRYSSEMSFYPESAGNLTISSLIAEVKVSSINQSEMPLFEPILTVCICKATPKVKRVLNLACVQLAC